MPQIPRILPEEFNGNVNYSVADPNEAMVTVGGWNKNFKVPRRMRVSMGESPADLVQRVIEMAKGIPKPQAQSAPLSSEIAPGGNRTEQLPTQVGEANATQNDEDAYAAESGAQRVEPPVHMDKPTGEDVTQSSTSLPKERSVDLPGPTTAMPSDPRLMKPKGQQTSAGVRTTSQTDKNAQNIKDFQEINTPKGGAAPTSVAAPAATYAPEPVPMVQRDTSTRFQAPGVNPKTASMLDQITALRGSPEVAASMRGGHSAGMPGNMGPMDFRPPMAPPGAAPAPTTRLGAVNMANQGPMDFRPNTIQPMQPPIPPPPPPQMYAQPYPYPGPAPAAPSYGLQARPSAGPMDFAPPTMPARPAPPAAPPTRPGQVNMASQGPLDMRPGAVNTSGASNDNALFEFGRAIARMFSGR